MNYKNLKLLMEMVQEIEHAHLAGQYAACQEGVVAVCEFIEKVTEKNTKTVAFLDSYYKLLYTVHIGLADVSVLNGIIMAIKKTIRNEFDPGGILMTFEDYKEKLIMPPYEKAKEKHRDVALFGWYFNNNVGGSLTFYALHQLLRSAGFSVYVANAVMGSEYFPVGTHINYDNVRDNYTLTEYYPNERLHEIRKYADYFVVASDQLWRDGFTGLQPEAFFLGCGDDTVKKISVATSFGKATHEFGKEYAKVASWLLNRFDHLSVREASGINILHRLGVRGAKHILDPCFLCDEAEYSTLIRKAKHKFDGAVFGYVLDMNADIENLMERAKNEISPDKNVYLMTTLIATKKDWDTLFDRVNFLADAANSDFLYNIKNAPFVITDSYHGACFCVIYRTPFIVLVNTERGEERYKLFEDIGLASQIILPQNADKAEFITEIDWESAYEKLNKMRESSFEFLENAFGRAFPRNFTAPVSPSVISDLPERDCTGCEGCFNICPENCITMEADNEGFERPKIDAQACTHCGLCVKACTVMQRISDFGDITQKPVYVGYSMDENIRFTSSSGGFFSELAKTVFESEDNVKVYGAGFDKNKNIIEMCVDDFSKLRLLRQSKYAQSKVGTIHRQINSDLRAGISVLFCGPPCYCGALKQFLKVKNTSIENLYLVDWICNSICSPLAYRAYLNELESKNGKIRNVEFRNKQTGWRTFSIRVDFEGTDNYLLAKHMDNPYITGFLAHRLYARKCCSSCHFKGHNRFSDITIADAWGMVMRDSEDYENGVSVAMINTSKGLRLFEKTSPRLYTEKHTYDDMLKGNPSLEISVPMGIFRNYFFSQVEKKPFSQIIHEVQLLNHLRILPQEGNHKSSATVSIVIPCYNAEGFLSRCLDSIHKQTHKNIEIICVDDYSTDKTWDIICDYEKRPREGIRFIALRQNENCGVAAAVELGLKHFTGEYLCWIDSDDYLTDTSIGKRVEALEKNPEYGIVLANSWVADESEPCRATAVVSGNPNDFSLSKWKFEDFLAGKLPFNPIGYMVRGTAFLGVNPKRILYHGREGQNNQLLLPVLYRYKCLYLHEPLGYIVSRSNSITYTEKTPEELQTNYTNILKIIEETLKQMNLSPYQIEKYLNMSYISKVLAELQQ